MRRSLRIGVASAIALLVIACAQLGLQPAQGFQQRLAYAYGTHTAILQATATAVTAGRLSQSDARSVLAQCDNARTLLDAAQRAQTAPDPGGTAASEAALANAMTVLTALQQYLQSRGVQ